MGLIEWRVAVEGTMMQRYYVNLVRQHSRFEIAESVHPHHQSGSYSQDDDDNMTSTPDASEDEPGQSEGSVVAESDYVEGLRDQWVPMGE